MATNYIPCGVIIPLSYNPSTIPEGFLLCDGSSYSTTTYANLFDLIGHTYGGSGANFNVPNLKDCRGYMDLNSTLGTISGANSITLNANQLPQHSHNVNTSSYQVTHSHNITYNSGNQYTAYINPDTNNVGQAGAIHQKGLENITTSTFNGNLTTGNSSATSVSGDTGFNTSNAVPINITNPFLKMYFYIKY